jgi:hypothetical protein
MGADYRTRHNAAMLRHLALLLLLAPALAHAWNAAGHRLTALIAWQQLSPAGRDAVATLLTAHPDHPRWTTRARSVEPAALLAEAATWPDDIRGDPRFHDEGSEPPTPPVPGLPDTGRHRRWHYVDLGPDDKPVAGELDRRIGELARTLGAAGSAAERAWALPWLVHLVGDIHQPLHVGHAEDGGGNAVEIEDPFNPRLPFTNLHTWWDDLPGPPWLRGRRLEQRATRLLAEHPPPVPGTVETWRTESHRLLAVAYPEASGSLLPIANEDFRKRSRDIADRRIVDAGYRLGWLLEATLVARVPRETK